jgi:hypothetical protein
MCKNFDLKDMPWSDLKALEKAIHFEKESRESKRFEELATAAADALNALKLEFPDASMPLEIECEYCNCSTEVDVLGFFDRWGANLFTRW